MLAPTLLASLALLAPTVRLSRTFLPNEALSYRVQASMQVQERARGLNTWMPEDLTIKYDFSTAVKQLKADGIAMIRYRRPTLTTIDDSGQVDGPERKVEKLDWDVMLTVSPLNKLIDEKKLSGNGGAHLFFAPGFVPQASEFGSFIGEVYRLALFAGGIDTSLDFAPPFPLREVAPGDTWISTVSYEPQKRRGKEGKSTVQRLDYTYTYKGLVNSNGRSVQRVVGS